jgi:regulator of sirC expression with transglutaminase-like and TPR domain
MSLAVATSENEQSALITLLADEDEVVYLPVRERILSCGHAACDWLRPLTLSNDPVLRHRAQEIIHQLGQQTADNRFLAFCLKHHGEEFDLEHAVWLLAQTQYPDANFEAYQALVDDYAGALRERINPAAKPKPVLNTINRFLFEELGFRGDEKTYYHPDNSYLNRVMDRRQGNPISLCLIYLFLARRLHLPVRGIGLPGHFLCRFQNSAMEIYIDAFYGGRFLTKADCIHHLIRGNHPLDQDFLSPVSSHRTLMRLCANLHQCYLRLGLTDEANRLQRYIIALAH